MMPRSLPSLVSSVLLAALASMVAFTPACSNDVDPSGFRGARLGMSAPDTRKRFHAPVAGQWAASVATTGEEAMTWTPSDAASSDVSTASFEFHNGMLVAIRAIERASAPEAKASSGHPITATPVTVRRLEPPSASDPEARLTILARDCPTHAAEVAAILK